MSAHEVFKRLRDIRIIPVVVIDDPGLAPDLAAAGISQPMVPLPFFSRASTSSKYAQAKALAVLLDRDQQTRLSHGSLLSHRHWLF